MFKRLSLRSRMLLSICTVAVLAFGITIGTVTYMARNTVHQSAVDLAKQSAWRYSGSIGIALNDAMDSARVVAQIFKGYKQSGQVPDRAVLNSMLKSVLAGNPGFLGIWTCWEPGALDEKDWEWIAMDGHDATGRFIPYWNRASGEITVMPLENYEVEGPGDYYLVPQKTGRETVLEPYEYEVGDKKMRVVSLVVPIKVGQDVLGAVGVDITMDKLQSMVSAIKPYETGDARLVTSKGAYAATADKAKLGADIGKDGVWPAIKQTVTSGKMMTVMGHSRSLGADVQRVVVPIALGQSGAHWGFMINVPIGRVMAQAGEITWITLALGAASLLVMVAVVFVISGSITGPIRRIVNGLGQGADQIAEASFEVSASSQSLAEGSSQQAASLEQTSASVEELTSMTKLNASNAGQADSLMREAQNIVKGANDSMGSLVQAMDRINQASDETAKIIKTIDEIAFQTNLLALNAAVEAARAGEAGAGFAVVADEVRNLAMRAAEAARNTAELIEGNLGNIRQGAELMNVTGQEFEKVSQSSRKVAELIGEIASASGEQSDGLDQVNKATTEMDSVTQRVASSAEQTAAAAQELSAQSHTIKAMVGDLAGIIEGGKGMNHKEIKHGDAGEKQEHIELLNGGGEMER